MHSTRNNTKAHGEKDTRTRANQYWAPFEVTKARKGKQWASKEHEWAPLWDSSARSRDKWSPSREKIPCATACTCTYCTFDWPSICESCGNLCINYASIRAVNKCDWSDSEYMSWTSTILYLPSWRTLYCYCYMYLSMSVAACDFKPL